MSGAQIQLFRPPRILCERVQEILPGAVPGKPGIYIMTGPGQIPLYIGQSANLKVRLAFYRNARAIWAWARVPNSAHAFPARFFQERTAHSFSLELARTEANESEPLFDRFLKGDSRGLLDHLRCGVEKAASREMFLVNSQDSDLESLETFFRLGPARNRVLKFNHNFPGGIVSREDLDDLISKG